jgi:site-specific DNA recombinase
MCAEGMSLAQIAKKLNAEGVPSPQPARDRKHRAWVTSSIREMLHNESYRGVLVWNRTKRERNPETGRKVSRPRPASEWKRVDAPELRIVPEDLWVAAHASFSERKISFAAATTNSGVSKSSTSKYLFSGLLVCGECGSKLVIVTGSGNRAYKKHGCLSHRYRGTCSNRLMIRVDRLEAQLLAFLESNILNREMAEYIVNAYETELNERLQEMAERSSEHQAAIEKLRAERDEVRAKAYKIGEAIATQGHSATLLGMLATADKIADIERRIEAHRPPDIKASIEEVRDYAYKALLDLKSLIRSVV